MSHVELCRYNAAQAGYDRVISLKPGQMPDPAELMRERPNAVRLTVYNMGNINQIISIASKNPGAIVLLMQGALVFRLIGYMLIILIMLVMLLINGNGIHIAAKHGMADFYRRFFRRSRAYGQGMIGNINNPQVGNA